MRPSYWRHRFRTEAERLSHYLYGTKGLLVRKRMMIRAVLIPIMIITALGYPYHAEPDHLQKILDRGVLKVGVRLGPLIYYERDDQPGGLDYYVVQALAQDLGLEVQYEIFDEIPELLSKVQSGDIDFAAAQLSTTPDRMKRLNFSRPYMEVTSVLIQHSAKPKLPSLDDLDKNAELVAIRGSSHAEVLRTLKADHPNLKWREESGTLMFELMQQIQNEEIEYAVIDSSLFKLEQPFFPRVELAMELDQPTPIALALRKSSDTSLLNIVNAFLLKYENSGALELLIADIFSNNERFDVVGSLVLRDRIAGRLPQYEDLFRKVGAEFDMDWVFLASIAYQESHWDTAARSYTGVRGLMMLTLPTAGQFGVTDRLDGEQSLIGGVRYLMSLKDRLPERIAEPDRTQLALAAYNMGMGHLEDARILTQRRGKNPDSWADVSEQLPLLQQIQYYKGLKHGYARGLEARNYVENIYHFYNILESYAWQKELESMNIRMRYEEDEYFEKVPPAPAPFPSILDNPLSPM